MIAMRFVGSLSDVKHSAEYQRVADVKCPSCSGKYILWAAGKADPSEVDVQTRWFRNQLVKTCADHSDILNREV
jgi:hypothetical protein